MIRDSMTLIVKVLVIKEDRGAEQIEKLRFAATVNCNQEDCNEAEKFDV